MESLIPWLKWIAYFAVILLLTAFAVRESVYWVFRVRMPFRDACILAFIMDAVTTALHFGLHYAVAATTQSSTEALGLVNLVMWPATALIHVTILSFRLDTSFLKACLVYLGMVAIIIATVFGLFMLYFAGTWVWAMLSRGR
jgi:hypothetical protein